MSFFKIEGDPKGLPLFFNLFFKFSVTFFLYNRITLINTLTMERKTAQELMNDITDFVNVYGFDKEGFKDAFRRQHRTLQQSTIRMFLEVIEMVGKEDYSTDLRNEDAKKVCGELVKGFRMLKENETGHKHDSFFPSQFLGHI